MMKLSRRGFLSGTAAFGLGGWRLFAAPPGWKHGGKPNLVFGVISDTHLRTANKGNGIGANWPDKYLAAALEYFKKQNVDAVAHCGDMAHRGQVEEMKFHANVWRKVFGKKGPVKLFVTGNHDRDGAGYGDFVKTRYPDEEKRAKHVLATDMAANWERIWGEPYAHVWHKEVKGYHFFGRNWGVEDKELSNLINASAAPCRLDEGSKPFFFLTHARPLAPLRKAVCSHRNAVSFFGHNHWSVANWNIPSLYYGTLPCIQCASCEPRGCTALVGDGYISKAKLEGREAENIGRGRQGYVVRLYDDMMVIERREFSHGAASLGADWVMPLNWRTGNGKRGTGRHPFLKDELKKAIGEPQFREGAKLSVECCPCENVAKTDVANGQSEIGTGKDNNPARTTLPPSATPRLRVKIPLADGNPDTRVYAYEVEVTGDDPDKKLCKAVYATGCNMGIGHEPNGGMTTLEIPKSELPGGKTLVIAVRPLTSLGTSGKAMATDFTATDRFPQNAY